MHGDLVRSVALGDDFVMSGSYDLTIKVSAFSTSLTLISRTFHHLGLGPKDWCPGG